MDFIRDAFQSANDFVEKFLAPTIDEIGQFFSSGDYFIIALVGIFVTLLVLIGLIRWLRRAPKLFIFTTILFGIVLVLWLVTN